VGLFEFQKKGGSAMNNNYEAPEYIEIGKAQDIILGAPKGDFLIPDSPGQDPRESTATDDE
jgi:hypothetical protein